MMLCRSRWRWTTTPVLAATSAILLGGLLFNPTVASATPASPFSPASPEAGGILSLFWITIIIAAIIFVGVWGVLLYEFFFCRARPHSPPPRPVFGLAWLEVTWTIIPIIILVVIFILTVGTMNTVTAAGNAPLDVTVTGYRWWWQFEYPGQRIVTANELHVPVGQTVRLTLRSADVIHSFWIPRLAGKTDLIPGQTNTLVFTAMRADTYFGQCAEFCGTQHAWMLLRVIAQSKSDFDAWVGGQQRAPAAPSNPSAQHGQQVFLTQACTTCHNIQGLPHTGTVGPDLTHVGSRETLGAGVLDNSPQNLRRWLQDPQQFKPGSLMPNFHLSNQDLDDLAAYLESLK